MLNGAEKTWAGAGIGERSHLERFAVSRAAPHGQGATILPA
jgi:stearoyl-CoA 9-desaturase NADPH oxidoreductase